MDEILAILMQENAYREQAKIKTYPKPNTNPVNQLITSPTKADMMNFGAPSAIETITATTLAD